MFHEIPAGSVVWKTLLELEGLVNTAKGNNEELTNLLELCCVVTKVLLGLCEDRSRPRKGLPALETLIPSAKEVAVLLCKKRRGP